MSNSDHVISVTILDRTYQIKCPAEEAHQLREAAQYLNNEIKKMNQSSQSCHVERLAIVAALNITHELLALQNQKNVCMDVMHDQIKSLQRRIQNFLSTTDKVPA